MKASPRGVSFDFGGVLADLDPELLARRLAERDWVASGGDALAALAVRLDAGVPAALEAYSAAIAAGHGGHPWKLYMRHLLAGAAIDAAAIEPAVDWLWNEQAVKNLWRRPVPGMLALVDELLSAGVPLGILSNSEGHLAELVDELGWSARFPLIADSGRLGLEKPSPAIFAWTAERLGVALDELVHIGDSWTADVEGALGAGARAVWFTQRAAPTDHPRASRLAIARTAAEVRAALGVFGLSAFAKR